MALIKIKNYTTASGKEPYTEWLQKLDRPVRAIVRTKIARVRLGNLGDCKPIKGSKGVWELRIAHGPGYRVYLGQLERDLMILLLGGDKGSQGRDIEKAKKFWLAFKESSND